ncbi:hypothetical protein FRC08_005975 [Ceratobasidium sp. 394]|nr:hypothetical protein FRC08_005975 [Ceratobasidium sp. 394]KAG9098007.1 hypothetical protein FS749_004931 [Ceratobasidium sp. UAMH 11750]
MPAIPFYDPDTNGFVYHVEPDLHTFYSESISEISSETESSESGQTIGTDDLPGKEAYFVQHHGRPQPAGNTVWWFPADNTRRFILRHFVESYIHGGNYAPIVKEMLPLDPGRTYHVLELGTRDGTWVQEMATEFPHVQFRSLDVAPIMSHVPRPNVVFEVYNFGGGLLLDDSSQDVVFLNVVFELIKDYPALIREAHRVLRPGGLIHIRDFDIVLYDSQNPSQLAQSSNPAGCHLLDIMGDTLTRMGVDTQTFKRLPQWLASEPNGEAGFENIQVRTKVFPAYPHQNPVCGHKVDLRIAPYLEHLVVMSFRDFTSILCDAGMQVDEANALIEEAIGEFRRPGNCVLIKLPCMYAVKKNA